MSTKTAPMSSREAIAPDSPLTDQTGSRGNEASDSTESLAQLFEALAAIDQMQITEGIVDLSLFVPGETVYRIPDAKGQVREYVVPNDLPFTVALAFLGARDGFRAAREDLAAAAGGKKEGRALKTYAAAHERLLAALRDVVALRQPKATVAELRDIGQGYIWNWVAELTLRLLAQRLQPFAKGKGGQSPKARRSRRTRPS